MKVIISFFYEVTINCLKRFLMCTRLEIRIRKGNYFFTIFFYIRKNTKSIEHNINYFVWIQISKRSALIYRWNQLEKKNSFFLSRDLCFVHVRPLSADKWACMWVVRSFTRLVYRYYILCVQFIRDSLSTLAHTRSLFFYFDRS